MGHQNDTTSIPSEDASLIFANAVVVCCSYGGQKFGIKDSGKVIDNHI